MKTKNELIKRSSDVAFGDVSKTITTYADGSTLEQGYSDSNIRRFRGSFSQASGGIAAAVEAGDSARALELQREWQARQQLKVDLVELVAQMEYPVRLEYFTISSCEGSFSFDGYWPINGKYLVTRTNTRSVEQYPPDAKMISGRTWAQVVESGLPVPYPQGANTPVLQWEADLHPGGRSCLIDNHATFVGHLMRMGMSGEELIRIVRQA